MLSLRRAPTLSPNHLGTLMVQLIHNSVGTLWHSTPISSSSNLDLPILLSYFVNSNKITFMLYNGVVFVSEHNDTRLCLRPALFFIFLFFILAMLQIFQPPLHKTSCNWQGVGAYFEPRSYDLSNNIGYQKGRTKGKNTSIMVLLKKSAFLARGKHCGN